MLFDVLVVLIFSNLVGVWLIELYNNLTYINFPNLYSILSNFITALCFSVRCIKDKLLKNKRHCVENYSKNAFQ